MCILVKIHQKARETVTWGRLYYSITKYNMDIELLELLEPMQVQFISNDKVLFNDGNSYIYQQPSS